MAAPVLKQRDDVVDMLRLVGLEREEPLEVLDGHVGDSRIVHRSMLDIVAARMTRRRLALKPTEA